MSKQIRVIPDQMRARANQYRAEAIAVNGIINRTDLLLLQLQSEREGAACRTYVTRYQELRSTFIKVEELIREISASLDSVANTVEETDIAIAEQFKAFIG